MTMTNNPRVPSEIESHKGSIFLPLPDGSALIYNLVGKSNPPEPVSTVELSIKSKKTYVHIIQVKNWLRDVQRFDVTWNFEVDDPSVFINGANPIDIAGETEKDYKLTIYSLK